MRLFLLSVLIFLSFSVFSQEGPYSKVDSLMRVYKEKIKSVDDLYKVVYYIRTNFDADSLRLRASFIWITENIAYDVKAVIREDFSVANLSYVVRYKKTICGGYASLLKYFCDAFAIENEIVQGYARTGKRTIFLNQNSLRSNHAWNAVKINGTWRLLDPTWASGYTDDVDDSKKKFHKKFKEVYYFTPPEKLILNHLPENKKFQLTNKKTDKKDFRDSPLFMSDFLGDDISEVFPHVSLIKAKVGDTLTFKLKTEKRINSLSVFSEDHQKITHTGTTSYENGWLELRFPVKKTGYYYLYIGYFENIIEIRTLLGYRLEVK
ncbi:hypothetical protein CAP36_03650 [Chitinophagaceae bacterium IBVUCB2]|nr:hypothetical protein CAP36_03650 [Chitinophagaceae bacterium IBVUCB2]